VVPNWEPIKIGGTLERNGPDKAEAGLWREKRNREPTRPGACSEGKKDGTTDGEEVGQLLKTGMWGKG